MNPIINKIKEENKKLAEDIKQLRLRRKPDRAKQLGPYEFISESAKRYGRYYASAIYRSRHIAYCELRGRKREQIEIPAEYHPANEHLIKEYKDQWTLELNEYAKQNEVVRLSA